MRDLTSTELLAALSGVMVSSTAAATALVLSHVNTLTEKVENLMNTLDDTLAAVTDEGTKEDGLIALVDGIEKQLADALAGTTLPPAVQAKVDAVFQGVTDNSAKVQAAIDKNTPPATGGGTGSGGAPVPTPPGSGTSAGGAIGPASQPPSPATGLNPNFGATGPEGSKL